MHRTRETNASVCAYCGGQNLNWKYTIALVNFRPPLDLRMELLQPQRFAMAELPAAKTFLEEQGYVVIRDVYTPEECDSFCARLKASIDALCPAAAAVPSLEQLAAGHLPPTDSNGLRSALAQSPAM